MINLSVFLLSIALVESGNVDSKIGKHHERSRFQITERVWKSHTKQPFSHCWGPHAESIAVIHLRWLIKNGVPEGAFNLGYAWNSGLRRWKRATSENGRISKASIDYANRVLNTYNDLMKKEKRENSR